MNPYLSCRLYNSWFQAVRQADAKGGVFNIATMEQLVSNRIARPRLYAVLLVILASIAVALAAIGII